MSATKPLERYRVIEFTTAWAGPMAGHVLADMGAQVIKVESREYLDAFRMGRPLIGDDVTAGDRGDWPELQPVFHALNRGKLSVTVNMKEPEQLGMLKRLVPLTDVVLNNFSTGVLERVGLGYDSLAELKPDIVFVSMPGAGETGPLKTLRSYAPIVHALSGLMSVVGYSENDLIGQIQAPWADAVGAVHAALATAVALHHRDSTGQGQHVEVSQLECTLSMLGNGLLDYLLSGDVLGPKDNFSPVMAPHNNFPCKDDRWVSIAVETDEEWEAFREALGDPEWSGDPRFTHLAGRMAHRDKLDELVSDWTREHTAENVTGLLQDHGVAAMPVMSIGDQFCDPHFRERGTYVEVEHPKVGTEWIHGLSWHVSGDPEFRPRHAPLLGEHNEYVFCELLGLPKREIQKIFRDW